ncbi:MAG: protein kinase [archaeon]|nr:protein kinase [archaeon]
MKNKKTNSYKLNEIPEEDDLDEIQSNFTYQEAKIFKASISEYEDLFPDIINLLKKQFLRRLRKYIEITAVKEDEIEEKKDFIDIVMKIIEKDYYDPDHEEVLQLTNKVNKKDLQSPFDKNSKYSYIPHCNNTKRPVHSCGNGMIKISDYLFCLKCNQIYRSSAVLFKCQHCNINYYTSIEALEQITKEQQIYKPATWEKYHCNAVYNDTMKCFNCKGIFYLNMNNHKLCCLKCDFEYDQNKIKWKCVLCGKSFISEAKVFNPLEYKVMKIALKKCLYDKIIAKPESVPCCELNNLEIFENTFYHSRDCKGVLYKGTLNGKGIVVCSKCHMLNYLDNHYWFCPVCRKRFNIKEKIRQRGCSQESKMRDSLLNFDKRRRKTPLKKEEEKKEEEKKEEEIKPVGKKKRTHRGASIDEARKSLMKEEFEKDMAEEKRKENQKINSPSKGRRKYSNDESEESNDNVKVLRDNIRPTKIKKSSFKEEDNNNIISQIKISPIKIQNISEKEEKNIKIPSPGKGRRRSSQTSQIDEEDEGTKANSKGTDSYKSKGDSHKSKGNDSYKSKEEDSYANRSKKSNDSYKGRGKDSIGSKGEKDEAFAKKFIKDIPAKSSKKEDSSPTFKSNINSINSEDYSIIKHIGEGSFGTIYMVKGLDGKKYAMKKIYINKISDIEAISKEYELLSSLEKYKLNLIKIHGMEIKKLDSTTHALYIIMDLANGDWDVEIDKRSKVKNYYSEQELRKIIKELIFTFSELQTHNISHRDIKPQNILMFDNNSFKIADFGEAKEVLKKNQKETYRQTIRGTELYMSPILFKALNSKRAFIVFAKHNSFKSDVFSLGFCFLLAATLSYQCLCDIRELDDMEKIKKIISEKYIKQRYSKDILNILFTMLEVNEKIRPDFLDLVKISDKL